MAREWFKTNFPGVRYRKHPTRKHGIYFDRYFTIRYKLDGKDKEERLGWASDGWTAQKAANELAELKKAHIKAEGAYTLKERRDAEKKRRDEEQRKIEEEQRASLTFKDFFNNTYMPQSRLDKSARSSDREESLFKLWIDPVIGNVSLINVCALDLERLKKKMSDADKSPRTIHYALAVIRQTYNYAKRLGIYEDESPVAKVKMPTSDNKRLRFLTSKEATTLLDSLRVKSQQVYEMSLLSLHCGLRAGEIFSLTWGDVDIDRGILTLRDTKSGKTRRAFMTDAVKSVLQSHQAGGNDDLVFPDVDGKKIQKISNTFHRTVSDLKLNVGVEDTRQKVVFHTLRHTYASWLVESGVDLYTVKELMGHGTLAMTERYAHLGQNTLQRAVKVFESSMALTEKKKQKTKKKRVS